jgi:pyruvate-formate lyase
MREENLRLVARAGYDVENAVRQARLFVQKQLVVRVAGYSALFTTLSRSLQDDIINRTEQGF